MAMVLDLFPLSNYFKTIEPDVSDNKIDQDKLDSFFITLTDIYVTIIEKGMLSVDSHFENSNTDVFFITVLSGLKQCVLYETISLILDFLLLTRITRNKDISLHELFEIYLLTKIMPTLKPDQESMEKYIYYLVEFCSGKIQHELITKFDKYIDEDKRFWQVRP